MPNIESNRHVSDEPKNEAHSSLFSDAYNFFKDTVDHPEARLRQAEVATIATISGGIQEARKEIVIVLGK